MQNIDRNLVVRVGRVFAVGIATVLAFSSVARAEPLAFALTIKDHKFDPSEIKIPANQAASLTVKNLDATPEEFESKPLRIEKVLPANGEATFPLRALKPGRYKFVGEFHEDSAKGEIVVE